MADAQTRSVHSPPYDHQTESKGPHLALSTKMIFFSIPQLTIAGLHFLLTDAPSSIMVTPCDECPKPRRQHASDPSDPHDHDSGFWFIDLAVTTNSTVHNANETVS